ncbi:DMT family transporter [Sporolactobacillus kofuensis]|uniref:DMT family transporter n=1 Tax=Sporolactobacillus kofuensis TaxID=269672 RepID=A0ABW1WBV7_9BACL|nr:DMT family transporter [Sporolactobacillus kofuensis]MCO7174900.1 DMT family transporter [Sporolactobacillus kofuensis]
MGFSRTFLAYLSAILFSVIIGLSFMFVKLSITYADPLDVLADRFSIAFVFAMVVLVVRRIKLTLHWRDIGVLLPLALLNPCLYFLTQALGLVFLPASEAGIIQAMLPVFTLILAALFLRERTNGMQKAATAVSVLGVVLIFVMNGVHFQRAKWIGMSVLFISTFTYAGYNVRARTMAQKFRMVDMTYLMIFGGFLSFNGLAIGNHLIHGNLSDLFVPFTDPIALISILYLGIMASFTTFFLSNFALSELEASKFGVFTNLTTIISIFSGVLFLHEHLFYYHYIGALMVVLGVVGVNKFHLRENTHPMIEKKNE